MKRGTKWNYVNSRVKPCGLKVHRLASVIDGFIIVVQDHRFQREFKLIKGDQDGQKTV